MFNLCGVGFYGFQPGQSKVAELILDKRCPDGIPMFSMPLHCDGLIMIPCTTGRIFLCNPATREFVELPQGSRNFAKGQRVAFGFDPWSGKYKVARHFSRSGSETPQADGEKCSAGHHEILTLGDVEEVWKWKSTMDPPYARTPICMRGSFYWSAVSSVTGGDGHKHNKDVAIWLAEDGPNLAWSVCCRLTLPIPRQRRVFACASGNGDEIFLSIDAWYLLKCDVRDGSIEEIIDMTHDLLYEHRNGIRFCTGERSVAHYMLPCVESLLRIIPL
ncbi:hypothetical protein HU200_022307 [Digitaria exilis]|uniref:F-box associated beta-propeller type 3 domain-containing protein n=1 Tax=Digitaria exilis TaxID=1010633 RepID=A0A835KAG0_9POAL|nr:hypothetical protein HU200_022307 [Digitaria exilis]